MTAAVPTRPRPRPAPQPRTPERPHLRVAPDLRKRRRRARLIVAGVAVVTIGSLFLLVTFHVVAAQSAFTLDKLSKQRTNEQLRYERLRDQVARLSSPDAVITEATGLGMVPASQQKFIQAEAAAPSGPTASNTPRSLSNKTYGQTKKALDQNP